MLSRTPGRALSLCLTVALFAACKSDPPVPGSAPVGSASASAPVAAAPHEPLKAPERSGGALMRSADGARLYLADEDHKCLRVLALPFGDDLVDPAAAASASAGASAAALPSASAAPTPSGRPSASASAKAKQAVAPPPPGTIPPIPPPPSARQEEIAMPGAPAQVLPLDGYVLVSIRDPGLLLLLKEEPGNKLKEEARIPLAADAWGLALTKDEKVAVVTSAWTHTVTGVDLSTRKVLWALDVAREPRGVVIHPNGKTAYVSHLTSGDLTRIDDVAGPTAKASTVPFPAAPMRTPLASPVPGSLGYALLLDDDGNRLLAARHALGAIAGSSSGNTWYGIPTIDVLQTQNDKPLLGPRAPDKRIKTSPAFDEGRASILQRFPGVDYRSDTFVVPELPQVSLVQPRAMIVAHQSQTVWLASEGDDSVGEFPLFAAAPIEKPLRRIDVGSHYKDPKILGSYGGYSESDGIPGWGGAPTGLALSADETLLYVFCRSTYDVATIRIAPPKGQPSSEGAKLTGGLTITRVATDPLDESASRGRRLFYGAKDMFSSEGMGCAGCHPDGRDDGHVWHEVHSEDFQGTFLASKNLAFKVKDGKLGYPRQTPMLAGRVNASGPYGWHAQSKNLRERLKEGFERHRWSIEKIDANSWMMGERANALEPFLRKGLVPPPRPERELTEAEKNGKRIFESPETRCAECHVPVSELTNRVAYSLDKLDPPAGFEDEEDVKFKTPSLLFVGGTAPYFHDGHAPTLEAVIAKNGDRMGKTSQLSAAEKAALVAYLGTL